MPALLRVSRLIDTLNEWIGRTVAWAIVLAVLVSAVNAIIRKVFGTSSNAWLELQWYLFGAVFMLCAAWTLKANEHIRIDIISSLLPKRGRDWIDIFGHVFFLLPFAILPIYVSLQKVDRTLIEAARDLGDSRLKAFFRITLPLSLPGVISAFLIVMIPTVGDYVTPRLVGGKDGVMIATAIQAQFGKGANWPLGAALSVTTMVLVSLTAAAVVLTLKFAVRRIK